MKEKIFLITMVLALSVTGCATTQQKPYAVRWINPDCPTCNYQSDLAACQYDVSLRYTPQQVSGGILTRVVIAANNATEPQRLMDLCMASKGWRAVAASETPKTPAPGVQALSPTEIPAGGTPTEIPLKNAGSGVYKLPVTVNGVITLNFILDTGASEVNIPADLAVTLWRAGTITENDFLPGKAYTLADGSKVNSSRLNIRELDIGGIKINQVPASISSINGSLLLGQSFLGRLGSWSLDNNRHILIVGGGTSSPKESTRTAKQRLEDCIQKANDNPAYGMLFKKMPKKGDPTLTQLSDKNLATDAEIKAVTTYYDEIRPCRELLINAMMDINPAMGTITAQSIHVEDFIIVDLIQRKITWGEANKKMSANEDEYKAKLREVCGQQKP